MADSPRLTAAASHRCNSIRIRIKINGTVCTGTVGIKSAEKKRKSFYIHTFIFFFRAVYYYREREKDCVRRRQDIEKLRFIASISLLDTLYMMHSSRFRSDCPYNVRNFSYYRVYIVTNILYLHNNIYFFFFFIISQTYC